MFNRDAFSKREQADENLYVRQKEMEKLAGLKKKIEEHQKHLDQLDKNMYVTVIGHSSFHGCYIHRY